MARREGAVVGSPRGALTAFLLVAVLALVVVSAGAAVISQRIARASALAEAQRSTERMAEFLVAPILDDALDGVPGRWEELDRRMDNRLQDQSIKAVFVWSHEGEVLYSSDDQLVGSIVAPTPELLSAIDGTVVSDIESSPELAFVGNGSEPLLEVYAPVATAGDPKALELYLDADTIDRQAMLLRGQMIPLAVGSLLALQLVQVPIAVSLFRRVRRQDVERADLLARNLTASDRERRAIAADVHDGPVQHLAGVSYGLAALRSSLTPEKQGGVDRMVAAVREAVASLRRLIVDLYPPDLSGAGLAVALEDMAETARVTGLVVEVQTAPLPDLTNEDSAAAVYRTAKEALANIEKHYGASHVWLGLRPTELRGRPAVQLRVEDDGVGFPDTLSDGRAGGHIGLRLMADRARDVDGVLHLAPREDGGASVTLVVPAGEPGGLDDLDDPQLWGSDFPTTPGGSSPSPQRG